MEATGRMSVYLALDPGTVTVGVAVSDPTATLARPLAAIPRKPHGAFLDAVSALVSDYRPEALILGLPLEADGARGKAAQAAMSLAHELRTRLKVEVALVDERYSTVEAMELLEGPLSGKAHEPGVRDKVAAAIILERFLGSLNAGPVTQK
jgi:putative Holliday junction resolvase